MKIIKILIAFLLSSIVYYSNAQWQACGGPYGGKITCITKSGSYIYVGTDGAGVFRSDNNGSSWTPVNNGISDLRITCFTVKDSYVFAGSKAYGIFRTEDNGNSWINLGDGLLDVQITALYVEGNYLWAGTKTTGAAVSNDNGQNWVPKPFSPPPYYFPYSEVTSFNRCGANFFAGTWGNKVYATNDYGTTWTNTNFMLVNYFIKDIAVIGDTVIAGCQDAFYWAMGCSPSMWASANIGMSGINDLVVTGHNMFTATISGVYFSNTKGSTWLYKGLSRANCMIVDGSTIFVGTDFGVYRSYNGGSSWTAVNNGLDLLRINVIESDGSGMYAGTDTSGVFYSGNNGSSWSPIALSEFNVYSVLTDGDEMFAGTDSAGLFHLNRVGVQWDIINNSLFGNYYIKPLLRKDSLIFAGTKANSVFSSSNNGGDWTTSGSGLPGTNIVTAFSENSSGIYAGTNGSGVYHSPDYGVNWYPINTGLGSGMTIRDIACIGSNVFAGTSAGVYLSTNGVSWNPCNTGITDASITSLLVKGQNIFAGTSNGGVFLSKDQGVSWAAVNQGLNCTKIADLTANGSYIFSVPSYRCTSGNLLWKRQLSEMIDGVEEISETPIIRMYPNPADEIVNIESSIELSTVEIYSLTGKLLHQQTTTGEISLDDFDQGIYFVKVMAKNNAIISKLIVVHE